MIGTEHYFPVVLLIIVIVYIVVNVVLTFELVDEALTCDYSSESY